MPHRLLVARHGVLRPTVLLAGFLLAAVVLGLASSGGWPGMIGVLLILGVVLALPYRFGDGIAAQPEAAQEQAAPGRAV